MQLEDRGYYICRDKENIKSFAIWVTTLQGNSLTMYLSRFNNVFSQGAFDFFPLIRCNSWTPQHSIKQTENTWLAIPVPIGPVHIFKYV